jgi:Protein of unknown function (DUF1488)
MLNFPNASRSYDATRHCVRFWGYDGALEVSFFVEEAAVFRIAPETRHNQAAVLESFDNNRERILNVARKVYSGRRQGSYALIPSDF